MYKYSKPSMEFMEFHSKNLITLSGDKITDTNAPQDPINDVVIGDNLGE